MKMKKKKTARKLQVLVAFVLRPMCKVRVCGI